MSCPAFFIGSRWRNARLFPRAFLGTNTDVWHKMCICVFTGCQDEARLYLMSLQPFIIRMGSNLSLENFFISLSAPDLHSAQETKTGSNVWKEVPETRSLGPPNHHTCEFIHMSSFLRMRCGAAVSMVHVPVCPSHPCSCPSVSMVFFIDFCMTTH